MLCHLCARCNFVSCAPVADATNLMSAKVVCLLFKFIQHRVVVC